MLSIIEKEIIIDTTIDSLVQIREDLRRRSKKSPLEVNIPFLAERLKTIEYAERQDHVMVDIFEGHPLWKDKTTINEFKNDTINFVE